MNVEDALCAQVGGELWFAGAESPVQTEQAMRICSQCPLLGPCLDEALKTPRDEDFGVWGGTTPEQRSRIRKNPALRERYMKQLELGSRNILRRDITDRRVA